MSTHALHPTPRWTAVVREQFLALGLALRREGILLALAVGFLTLLIGVDELREAADPATGGGTTFRTELFVPLVLFSFFVPLGVWKGEGPGRRSYHWAMPVDRTLHTLTRVLAGWAWLMVLVALATLWLMAICWMTGGEVGVEQYRAWDATGERMVELSQPLAAWKWLVPFTAATVAYLIGSVIGVASDHPWSWMAGLGVGIVMLSMLVEAGNLTFVANAMERFVLGRWGVQALVTGETTLFEQVTRRDGRTWVMWTALPDLGAWLRSTALWTSLALGGVLLAARRHPDR